MGLAGIQKNPLPKISPLVQIGKDTYLYSDDSIQVFVKLDHCVFYNHWSHRSITMLIISTPNLH